MNIVHKEKILKFLQSQKLAVISTVNPADATPESALIAFAENNQLQLYFQTGIHTRKMANLKVNPYVSLVIGLTTSELVTLQYEGYVEQLVSPLEVQMCKDLFVAKKSPTTLAYLNHPSAVLFRIKPTWIGCSDYSAKTPEVIEIKSF